MDERERKRAPQADNSIIPPGVFWVDLYDRTPGVNRVVAVLEVAEEYMQAYDAADRDDCGTHARALHHLVLAGIPFRVLTPQSDPEIAQHITHHNARLARLIEERDLGNDR